MVQACLCIDVVVGLLVDRPSTGEDHFDLGPRVPASFHGPGVALGRDPLEVR